MPSGDDWGHLLEHGSMQLHATSCESGAHGTPLRISASCGLQAAKGGAVPELTTPAPSSPMFTANDATVRLRDVSDSPAAMRGTREQSMERPRRSSVLLTRRADPTPWAGQFGSITYGIRTASGVNGANH
jgi:hypothetical protein